MRPRSLLLTFALAAILPLAVRATEGRFSQMLSTGETIESGVVHLSSDQVAVLDALVRRDLANQAEPRRDDKPLAAKFSQRLTADERRTAGLTLLSEAEVARLDALVEQRGAATLARMLLAPPVFAPTGMRLRPTEQKTAPEIHGSVSLSFGAGKGYSEQTGAMTFSYTDPTHGFSVLAGYSESRVKLPAPYREGYLIAPPPYAP